MAFGLSSWWGERNGLSASRWPSRLPPQLHLWKMGQSTRTELQDCSVEALGTTSGGSHCAVAYPAWVASEPGFGKQPSKRKQHAAETSARGVRGNLFENGWFPSALRGCRTAPPCVTDRRLGALKRAESSNPTTRTRLRKLLTRHSMGTLNQWVTSSSPARFTTPFSELASAGFRKYKVAHNLVPDQVKKSVALVRPDPNRAGARAIPFD
jgi:hypothetical protein